MLDPYFVRVNLDRVRFQVRCPGTFARFEGLAVGV